MPHILLAVRGTFTPQTLQQAIEVLRSGGATVSILDEGPHKPIPPPEDDTPVTLLVEELGFRSSVGPHERAALGALGITDVASLRQADFSIVAREILPVHARYRRARFIVNPLIAVMRRYALPSNEAAPCTFRYNVARMSADADPLSLDRKVFNALENNGIGWLELLAYISNWRRLNEVGEKKYTRLLEITAGYGIAPLAQ